MKREAPSKLKFKRLKTRLRMPWWQVVGILESLWHVTVINAPDGAVGRFSNGDIAALIEYEGDPDELIAALVDSEWLDRSDEFRLVVHDWVDHCPTYLKGAFAKHKKTFASAGAKQAPEIAKPPPKQPLPNQTKPNQSPPPSSSVSSSAKQAAPKMLEEGEDVFDPDGDEWDSLNVLLRRNGVGDADVAIRAAIEHGCAPADVGLLIGHFEAHPKAWGPGLLYARVMRLRHGDDPAKGWTEPSDEWHKLKEASRPPRAIEPSRAEVMAQDKALREGIEQTFGAEVDAMTVEQLREAVAGNEMLMGRIQRAIRKKGDPRKDFAVREHVLHALSERAAT
jgi:hypothetical protein